MTICKVFAALVLISLPASGQSESFGLTVEVRTSFLFVESGSFQDPTPFFTAGNNGWLTRVRTGHSYEGKLFVNLPYGFKPFVGYHFASLIENGEKIDLMNNLYAQDRRANFDQATLETDYRLFGFDIGVTYEPVWIDWRPKPYLGIEIRADRFTATTQLGGYGKDFSVWPFGVRFSGPVSGDSNFRTDTNLGFAACLGFRFSIENFSITPQTKYVTSVSTITVRRSQWEIILPEGKVGNEFLPDNAIKDHSITKRFYELGVGLQYHLF